MIYAALMSLLGLFLLLAVAPKKRPDEREVRKIIDVIISSNVV